MPAGLALMAGLALQVGLHLALELFAGLAQALDEAFSDMPVALGMAQKFQGVAPEVVGQLLALRAVHAQHLEHGAAAAQ